MIKYNLICKKCNLSFDSWFASSGEYEKLKKKNFLSCHNCTSSQVEKNLMAPKLMSQKLNDKNQNKIQKTNNIKDKIKEYQKFIKDNFKYVGENFAYEARSIYYNKNKKKKGIYGSASKNDLKELKEEGIDTQVIPWIKDNEN